MPDDPQLRILTQLMDVASLRARVHAGNLANQNTPGYKARAVDFEDAFRAALDQGSDVAGQVAPRIYEPRTTAADIDGNDVAPDKEVLAMAQNQMLYNAWSTLAQGRLRLINTAISPTPGG